MVEQKEKKGWLEEIEIMRAIGIIAVVLIHITGPAISFLEKGSLSYEIYAAINYILQFAVPMFVMVSALILAYKYSDSDEHNWPKFYAGRVKQIIVPYLIWTAIYLGYNFFVSNQNAAAFLSKTIKNWPNIIFFGKAYTHLYFISIIMQFYLIFPLILAAMKAVSGFYKKISQKGNRRENSYLDLGTTAFFGVLVLLTLMQYAFIWLNKKYIYFGFDINLFGHNLVCSGFKYTGTLIFSYIMPAGLGLWLGWNLKTWHTINRFARCVIYPLALVSAWLYIGISLNPRFLGIQDSLAVAMIRNTYVTLFSLMLYDFALLIKVRFSEKVRGILIKLGTASFGIYLIHPLIHALWNKVGYFNGQGKSIFVISTGRVIAFVLALGVSWAAVELSKNIPYAAAVFGNRGRTKQAK